MDNQADLEIFVKLAAVERLLTWLTAKYIMASGEDNAGLQRLSDELHSLLDENRPPDLSSFQDTQEMISAEIDGLVQETALRLAGRGYAPSGVECRTRAG